MPRCWAELLKIAHRRETEAWEEDEQQKSSNSWLMVAPAGKAQ